MRGMNAPIDRAAILERLQKIVLDKVAVDPAALKPEVRLADIGVDSFALIELVFLAEEEFRITIPLEDLDVKTIGDVLDVIQDRVAETSN